MLCAVYTRQSVRSEGDLTSCEVQREMCMRFAKARGLLVSGERFDDEGITGVTLERPALQRLLSAVRAGSVGAVVVHRLDRLSRRVRDCTALVEEFKAHNVRLHIAAMPELRDGAADTLMLNILSAFADYERDMIASRIRDTRAGLIARPPDRRCHPVRLHERQGDEAVAAPIVGGGGCPRVLPADR